MQCQLRSRTAALTIIEALTLLAICVIILFVVIPTILTQQGILKPVLVKGAVPPPRPKEGPLPVLVEIPPSLIPNLPPLPEKKLSDLEKLEQQLSKQAPNEFINVPDN